MLVTHDPSALEDEGTSPSRVPRRGGEEPYCMMVTRQWMRGSSMG